MRTVGLAIELFLFVFLIVLLIRLVVDWIQMFARSWHPRGPVLVLLEGVYTLTDPPVKALRKVLPSIPFGSVRLDLSFLALLVLVYVALYLNRAILL